MDTNSERSQRAPIWNMGVGDGLSQAATMVITPLLFVLFGVFLDNVFATGPWIAIFLGVFAVAGTCVVTYLDYNAKMDAAEAGKPWRRTAAAATEIEPGAGGDA